MSLTNQPNADQKNAMKRIELSSNQVQLAEFLAVIQQFAGEDALGIVVDGGILFHSQWGLYDEELPDEPVECLNQGRTLFARFTSYHELGFDCADGNTIELPDGDDNSEIDPECSLARDSEDHREEQESRTGSRVPSVMLENTIHDDSRCYGYIIFLQNGSITFHSAICSDVTGESILEPVTEPNLLDQPMAVFVLRFRSPPWCPVDGGAPAG